MWTIKAPIKFWPELKSEFVTFFRTVRGTTKCCNIVRSKQTLRLKVPPNRRLGTAMFAILGTSGVSLLFFSVTLLPFASFYFAGTAYRMGEELYESTLKKRSPVQKSS